MTTKKQLRRMLTDVVPRKKLDAAERRIAAALACHTRVTVGTKSEPIVLCGECDAEWDTVADRCTSPTVRALVGDG